MMPSFSSLIPLSLRPDSFNASEQGDLRWSVRLLSGLLAFLLVPLLLPETVQAQTPTATVKNGKGTVRLQTFYDGGLVAPGLFDPTSPADSIPATGAGTRMMWYPAKAAFRAGRVGAFASDKRWNASKIGKSSVALGRDPMASGRVSTAIGDGTTASAFAATALGYETTASATRSTAIGDQTTASGTAATAMGSFTRASGNQSTAMGAGTVASSFQATAMGLQTTASGANATAMGEETVAATNESLTIGEYNNRNRGNDDSDPTTGPLFVVGNGSSGSRSDAFYISQNGTAFAKQGHQTFSDRRLKTGIAPLGEDILKKLSRLRPVRYRFKNQEAHPSGPQLGLVAQDVQKEFPSLVSKGPSGYLSLAYPKLTAVLLKGLQEQQHQIEVQKKQLKKQRATISSLKKKVRQIETLKTRVARLESQSNGSVLAGLSGTALLAVLLALGGFGAGVLWRRRA